MTLIKCDKCGKTNVIELLPPEPTISMDSYFNSLRMMTQTLEMNGRKITLKCPDCGYAREEVIY